MSFEDIERERDQEAREDVLELLAEFFRTLNVTPPRKLPRIEIIPYEEESNDYFGVDLSGDEVIAVKRNSVYGGWGPVEEIGHYLRHLLGPVPMDSFPTKKIVEVQEFYAYVARRLSQHILSNDFFLRFANYPLRPEIHNQAVSLAILKNYRESENKMRAMMRARDREEFRKHADALTGQDMMNLRKGREIREHRKSYRYAEQLDLHRVDLMKLFTLTDDEVKRRFFTRNPDYSDLEPTSPLPDQKPLVIRQRGNH